MKKTQRTHYQTREWLNPITSSSTGSVVAYDGTHRDDEKEKVTDVTFLEVADCFGKITLHKREEETRDDFIQKLKLLRGTIDEFIKHLEETI